MKKKRLFNEKEFAEVEGTEAMADFIDESIRLAIAKVLDEMRLPLFAVRALSDVLDGIREKYGLDE